MADHQSTYPGGGVTGADAWGAVRPPNKGMKLTSVERIERSQLIPGVMQTAGGGMKLARRASLKTPGWSITDGPPLACPSGIVVGGETVTNFDRRTLRPLWRVDESLAIRGCFGHVLVAEHDLEDPLSVVRAIRLDPYVRTARLAVGVDSTTGQTIWRRKVRYRIWVVGGELVTIPWERNEIQLLEPNTGEARRSLRDVLGGERSMAWPCGVWKHLLFLCGTSHRRDEDPVHAVDLRSGEVIWRQPLIAATHELAGGPESVSAVGVSGGQIILTAGSVVVAFSCENGQHSWTHQLPSLHHVDILTPTVIAVAGAPPPGVAWIDPVTGLMESPSEAQRLRGESFEVHGTFRGRLVCSCTAQDIWLVDPLSGNVSRHRIPRTEVQEAAECHQYLCLADEGRRVLILEVCDEAA